MFLNAHLQELREQDRFQELRQGLVLSIVDEVLVPRRTPGYIYSPIADEKRCTSCGSKGALFVGRRERYFPEIYSGMECLACRKAA